jgi:uncharacterized membrane protein YciS (DUF1049 family)
MNSDAIVITIKIFQSLATVMLYFFLSFGPGFIIGILIANAVFGRGKVTLMEFHMENKKIAAQHNAQWDPSNPRWRE